ncbi:class I SAM-dependent methyltransferase [Chitinophagaceae bacterium MMS25-I14]
MDQEPIVYLEFGVATGNSFKWWSDHLKNEHTSFWGFDTFEGLPEKWGAFFKKGDMASDQPELADIRTHFVKGIFQDTLCPFIASNMQMLSQTRKIIHMDADLFSSTIFVLSQLYPYLKKGDLIFFDEFNVANHEWQAFQIFTQAFYVNLKPVGAVNNFYQTAFVVE